jgi:hypothetical protein
MQSKQILFLHGERERKARCSFLDTVLSCELSDTPHPDEDMKRASQSVGRDAEQVKPLFAWSKSKRPGILSLKLNNFGRLNVRPRAASLRLFRASPVTIGRPPLQHHPSVTEALTVSPSHRTLKYRYPVSAEYRIRRGRICE